MSEKTYACFIAVIGVVCGWGVIRCSFSPASLSLRDALVQGLFVGFGLAVVTIEIVARARPNSASVSHRPDKSPSHDHCWGV
jgi:hypothetical protein